MKFYYLHGFASGPESFKALYFKNEIMTRYKTKLVIPDLNTPSFEEMTISSQVELVSSLLEKETEKVTLFGSSLGALVCLLLEEKYPEIIEALVLLAPAFDFYSRFKEKLSEENIQKWETSNTLSFPHHFYEENRMLEFSFYKDSQDYEEHHFSIKTPTIAIHGYQDETIPFGVPNKYLSNKENVTLKFVNDDHSLKKSLPLITQLIFDFINIHKMI